MPEIRLTIEQFNAIWELVRRTPMTKAEAYGMDTIGRDVEAQIKQYEKLLPHEETEG